MPTYYSSLTLSRRSRLLAASALWTLVGFVLLCRGLVFLIADSRYLMVVLVLLLGTVKFFLVFRNTAQKNVMRVRNRKEWALIHEVFPLRTWILMSVMIILGFLLRGSPLPREFYSLIISGVGLGMVFASTVFWKAWMEEAGRADD